MSSFTICVLSVATQATRRTIAIVIWNRIRDLAHSVSLSSSSDFLIGESTCHLKDKSSELNVYGMYTCLEINMYLCLVTYWSIL